MDAGRARATRDGSPGRYSSRWEHWAWMAAVLTIMLWLPPLLRPRLHPWLEIAYQRGGIVVPALGLIMATTAIFSSMSANSRRTTGAGALTMNAVLIVAYVLTVYFPMRH